MTNRSRARAGPLRYDEPVVDRDPGKDARLARSAWPTVGSNRGPFLFYEAKLLLTAASLSARDPLLPSAVHPERSPRGAGRAPQQLHAAGVGGDAPIGERFGGRRRDGAGAGWSVQATVDRVRRRAGLGCRGAARYARRELPGRRPVQIQYYHASDRGKSIARALADAFRRYSPPMKASTLPGGSYFLNHYAESRIMPSPAPPCPGVSPVVGVVAGREP